MNSAIFLTFALLPLLSTALDDKKWVWNDNTRRSDDDGDANVVNARPSVNQIKIKLDDQDDATSNKYTQDAPSSDDPYDTFSGGPVSGNFRPPPDYSRPYNPAANLYPQVGGNNYPNNGEPGRYPQNGERYPQNDGRFPQNGGKYPVINDRYPEDNERYPSNGNDRYPGSDRYPGNDRYPNQGSGGYGQGGYPNNDRYPNRNPGGNRYPSDGNSFPGRFPNNKIDRYPSGGRYPNEGDRYPVGGQYPGGGPYPQQGGYPGGEGYYPDQDKFSPNNLFRPFRPNQSFRPGQGRPYPPSFEGPIGPGGQSGQGGGNKCACVDRFQCPSPGMLGGQCAPGKSLCCYNRPGGFNRPGPAVNPLTGRPIHHPANGVLAGPGGPVDNLPGLKTNPDNTGDGSSAYPIHLGFGNGFQSIDDFHKTYGFHNTNSFKPINGFHNINGFQPVSGFQNRNGFVPIIPVKCQNNCNNIHCNGGGGNTNQVNFGNCNSNELTSHASNNNGLAPNNNNNLGINHNSGSNGFQASFGVHGTQGNSGQNGFQNNGVTATTANGFQKNFGATNIPEQNGLNNNNVGQNGGFYNNGVGITVSSVGFNTNNNGVTLSTNGFNNNNNGRYEFNNNNKFINGQDGLQKNNEVGIGVTVSTIGINNNKNGGQNGFNNNNGGQNNFNDNNTGQNGASRVKPNMHTIGNGFGVIGTTNTNINTVGIVAGSGQRGFQGTFGVNHGNANGFKPNMNIHQFGGNSFGITGTIDGSGVGINIGGREGGVTIAPVIANHNTIGFNTVQANTGVGINNFQNNMAFGSNAIQNYISSGVGNFLNTNALGINSIQENVGSTTNFNQNNHVNTNNAATNVFQNNNIHSVNGVQGNTGVNVLTANGSRGTGVVNAEVGGTVGNGGNVGIAGTRVNVIPGVNVGFGVNGNGGNIGIGTTGLNFVPGVNVGFRMNENKGALVNGGTLANQGIFANGGALANGVNIGLSGTEVNVVPRVNIGFGVNGNGGTFGNGVNFGVSGTRVNIVPGVNAGINGNGGNRGNIPRPVSTNNSQFPINLSLLPIAQNGSGGLILKLKINTGANISNSVLGSQPYFNGSNGKPLTFRVIGARFGPPKPGGVRIFNGSRAAHIRQNGPNGYRTVDDRDYARPLYQMDWLNGMANAFKFFYRIISSVAGNIFNRPYGGSYGGGQGGSFGAGGGGGGGGGGGPLFSSGYERAAKKSKSSTST